LIGRSEEMRTIEAAMSATDLSGIVVRGAAGVGKSRIVREAMSAAAPDRYECRWTVGTTAAQTLPLGAFASWLDPGNRDRLQLVRGVIESLTSAAPGITVVLGVDDAQLVDELSAFVLHQIVQRGAAKLLLTVRDGEPIPDTVREVWKDGQFDRLDLQPLSHDETTALLAATLGRQIDPDAASRLWHLTSGNVLYLRNIVERELADGRIRQHKGCWRWIGEPIMPNSLIELIESRIGALPPEVGDVIDVVAVGEPISLASLRRLTDPHAVEDANTRGLITLDNADDEVVVRVAHPLYGETRRARVPSTRLRRLRGLVAEELAASESRDDIRVVVRRAALMLDSDLEPDADLHVRAAQGAIWLADLALADRLAAAAVRAGAGPDAYFLRAHALSWLFSGAEAEAMLASIPDALLDDQDCARFAYLRASNMLWALGKPERAKEIIDDAAQTAPPQARSWIDAFLTVYWFAMDQPGEALQTSKALALDKLPAVVGAETAWALSVVAADSGRTADAVSTANAGYTAVSRSFDAPHMGFNIADAHISALWLSGQNAEALQVAERVQKQAADLPGAAHPLGAAVAGRAALGAGRLDTACLLLEQAVGALSAGNAIGWGYRYSVPLATALAIRGSINEAAALVAELDKRERPFRSLDFERSLARAWVVAGQGIVSEAIAIMTSAAQRAAASGQFAVEVMCWQTATQFGDHSGASRLHELESIVEGPRAGPAARFAAALRDCDGTELAALSEEFEKLGDLIAAVDAAAHAAIAHRHNDRRGSALACATRADALAQQCGGARTPIVGQASERLPLTDREREIVMLIGRSMSTRAVAERLTLSVRTVEGHLYRAMVKTGTTSREELIGLLRQLPKESDRNAEGET
jgi:DNA-binding CsgD family transcriptional regulator/tetratricopeptide (TPR) repeat protein